MTLAVPTWVSVLWKSLPYFWGGLVVTLQLSVISITLSFVIGVVLGISRLSRLAPVRWAATAYVEFVRAIPLIMVIFWIFFLLPIVTGHPFPSFQSAVVAFVVFTSAYVAEIVRAGIQSVPVGQREAALSSGLTHWQTMWAIVLPQALTKMIPPLVGQFISLFKDTSLAYIIGVLELTRRATIVNNRDYQSFAIFGFVAIVYFAFCYALSTAARRLEVRLAVGRR